MRIWQWTQRAARTTADFIYPAGCLWCGAELTGPLRDIPFCHDCQDGFSPHSENHCRRCSAPVGPGLKTDEGCQHCRREKFSFQRVISLGPHDGPLQQACVQSKVDLSATLAGGLARMLARQWDALLHSWQIDAVIPVPHHWTNRLWSTRPASDTVAEWLGRFLMVPVERHILCKVKRTPKQAHLSSRQRHANLRNAFRLKGNPRLEGTTVLLTDDVLTTGTTARRAADALLAGGAGRVYVAVLARRLSR